MTPQMQLQQEHRAVFAVLLALDFAALSATVWRRLTGDRLGRSLPMLSRDEDPSDIFSDYVCYCEKRELLTSASDMRRVCVTLIGRKAQESPADAAALVELCYLTARISAPDALDPLASLIQSHAGNVKMPNGNPVRSRALRALVGLLRHSREPESVAAKYRNIFEEHLTEPGCQDICLTALAGYWPGDFPRYRSRLCVERCEVPESALNVSLRLAGFEHVQAR